MNGPSKSENEKGFDWMEWGIVFAGVMVVSGLFMEAWPEIKLAITERRFPNLPVTGGIIVTVGVLIEVALGIFITQRANRAQSEANAIIAETKERASRAEERAALAEQAAAEANLARAQIEQRMKARTLAGPVYEDLKALLIQHGASRVDVVVFDHHIPETQFFAQQVLSLFVAAGWRCEVWESRAAKYRIGGASTILAVADGHVNDFKDLPATLAGAFQGAGIDCGVSLGRFSAKGLFTPGDFQSVFKKPLVIFGRVNVAPFRVQIGAKQLAALPLPRSINAVGIPKPVTPPQA